MWVCKLTGSLLGLTELVSAGSKDLVEVVLEPPDVWAETSKLPHTVDLLVPVGVCAVGVALDGDLGAGLVGVLLVWHTELVVADDLVVGDLLPHGSTDKVLGLEGWVTEDIGVGCHLQELFRWHGLPDLVKERTVVDSEGGGNAGL